MSSRSTRTESRLAGSSRDRFWLAAGILVLALHAISFHFFEIDDAYISFRYARNLMDGYGLVFNPSDPVEGYSNLLWVLISALGMALGIDPLLWARIIGFWAAVGIVILTPAMVRRLNPQAGWVAGAGAVLVACWGPLACWSLAGLETVFCAFLMLLAWRAAMAGRSLTVGVVGWMLALTRPDGLALGAALARHGTAPHAPIRVLLEVNLAGEEPSGGDENAPQTESSSDRRGTADIVVAPGPGGLMIASDDTEALDAVWKNNAEFKKRASLKESFCFLFFCNARQFHNYPS